MKKIIALLLILICIVPINDTQLMMKAYGSKIGEETNVIDEDGNTIKEYESIMNGAELPKAEEVINGQFITIDGIVMNDNIPPYPSSVSDVQAIVISRPSGHTGWAGQVNQCEIIDIKTDNEVEPPKVTYIMGWVNNCMSAGYSSYKILFII